MILVPQVLETLHQYLVSKNYASSLTPFYICSPGEEVLRARLCARGERPDEIEHRILECRHWDGEAFDSGFSYYAVENSGVISEAITTILNHIELKNKSF